MPFLAGGRGLCTAAASRCRSSGKDIPPAEVEETVKMFNVKMMNKYLSVWKDRLKRRASSCAGRSRACGKFGAR